MSDNQPLSEIYKLAGDEWVDLDATARLLEETKSLRFAQKCAALGDIAVNKAEQTIKASRDWMDDVIKTVDARTVANKARVYMESVKMRHSEWQSEEANHRAEARL
jgi:hypothetical protein